MKFKPEPPLSDAELDELAAFLESDATGDECMDLSMLHGFLTAIRVGPREPEPAAWLAQVWGEQGQTPKFASAAQQTRIEDLILRYYNQLGDELVGDMPAFTPLVYVDEETGTDIVQQWCYGFMLGTAMAPEAWQPAMDDDEIAQLLAPIFDCADDEAREAMTADGDNLAEFEHELAAALPDIIPVLRAFWLARLEAAAPRSGHRRH
ncbi:UPF0149 family protein [Jeongeupia chitinilytica]|uniref:YecA family protein n=1 Tax=Jeongeupia chitinilytica TaxID=1041641 RepID=A0ABQ3H256_9NEIS|nr:UPF0149 family protein [Jeongeupia chitinilytica]GHD66524.1 hypothetical protein GCM10007350_28870 [Jeongeupia chitinilytica]